MRTGIYGLLVLMLLGTLAACGKSAAERWQEQYDLGMKYLEEQNYEEAIVAFTGAIEIDPNQPDTYIALSDIYAVLDDIDNQRAILEQGIKATEDEDINLRLENLEGSQNSSEDESVYDYFQIQMASDGLDVDAKDLMVHVQDNRTATITISSIPLQESYLTNLASSTENMTEYSYKVDIMGQQTTYRVATASWAFEPGAEEEKTLADLQHSVWIDTGDTFHRIGDAQMTYTEDSITWTFSVPEEYAFDFANVEQYVVNIYDVTQNLSLSRTYTLE